ncbi:hypothetical protein CFOL_v3_05293 [Cephalotus follicularis]|uniref:Uncharacterized protein n=1 Tax=Cephalotus follicularis TaxID=3775 RepID=A0A1Q3B185_CEPFO|nr:hypothetical protein CFOL_v3_05293 [Cephalotus follicularis]
MYTMQTQAFPISIYEKIDKLHMDFIWNDWPSLGNGESINIWADNWIERGPLIHWL